VLGVNWVAVLLATGCGGRANISDSLDAHDLANSNPAPDTSMPSADVLAGSDSDTLTLQDPGSGDLLSGPDLPAPILPPAFTDLAGHTFSIAASATPSDATMLQGVDYGSACMPTDSNATYDLTFSSDGGAVAFVRTDATEAATYHYSVFDAKYSDDTRLHFWFILADIPTGHLVVWFENGALVAQLIVRITSCIQSPMTLRDQAAGG
jgi:hypothetical protein